MKGDKKTFEESKARTSEKREYIEKNFPGTFDFVNHSLNTTEFRAIDTEMQNIPDVWVLQYVITLLCDELIYICESSPYDKAE